MPQLGWENSAQIWAYTYLALHCIHIKPHCAGREELWFRTFGLFVGYVCDGVSEEQGLDSS